MPVASALFLDESGDIVATGALGGMFGVGGGRSLAEGCQLRSRGIRLGGFSNGLGGDAAHQDRGSEESAFHTVLSIDSAETGGFTGGVETWDGLAAGIENAAVGIDMNSAHTLADEDEHRRGVEGRLGDGFERTTTVELRVLTDSRHGVVAVDRFSECVSGEARELGELGE